ncbi:MAG: hypothetical protein DI568_10035 [Sphingomonas sp.]|nr:MAG: hypothetical protein DI568_10035 [Sphingomonas sp.]
MALLIPIVAIIMKNWRQVQNRKMDLMERGTDDKSSAALEVAQARVAKLEARIAVLERIVTDKRTTLADEIDALGVPASRTALPPRFDQ